MAASRQAQDAIQRVAADRQAEDRLHDKGVEIHHGGQGAIATLEEEQYSAVVYARSDVDQGELHEALAAVFLQLALTTEWDGDHDE